MKQFWTWSGRYIGVQQGDYLVTCGGKVLGKFYGKEIYNQEGQYIGEIGRDNRIYINRTKAGQRRPIFSYGVRGCISARSCEYPSYPLTAGYEEFEFFED